MHMNHNLTIYIRWSKFAKSVTIHTQVYKFQLLVSTSGNNMHNIRYIITITNHLLHRNNHLASYIRRRKFAKGAAIYTTIKAI
jgi:hypothetical protein